jgi:hypothetical protein
MENNLISEFEKNFEELKKKHKIKSSLNELDEKFLIRDYIEKEGFVSTELLWQIRDRIMSLFSNWANYLHGIVMPNPGSMFNITESEIFDDQEKEELMKKMSRFLTLTSKNAVLNITKNKKEEAKIIDESLKLWNELAPELEKLMIKVHDTWKEKS